MPRLHRIALAFGLLAATHVWADDPEDHFVQPPNLDLPQRGSLAGSLSGVTYDAAQLSAGVFALPLPITAPEGRGALLVDPWPSYSADNALGEWGHGWAADGLTIRRYRAIGEPDYATDDLASPWGILGRGDDGAYYPRGNAKTVRVVVDGGGLRATKSDGTVYELRADDAITTPRGTYAWQVSEVRTLDGQRAVLTYARGTGRRYLSRIAYGGRSGESQYGIDVGYEMLAHPIVDYRSGVRATLDRRVHEIRIMARTAGTFTPVRTYHLAYEQSALGQAFYLSSLRAIHASGAEEPTVRYSYDLDDAWLGTTPHVAVPGLHGYLSTQGAGALMPRFATPIDFDRDGLVDFEHHAGTLYRQTAPGAFVAEPLPPVDQTMDQACRPKPNTPRRLAWMAPEDTTASVVDMRLANGVTELRICDRAGRRRELHEIAGQWQLDKKTRLVDLDRDGRPDLVRVSTGSYEVVANHGTWTPRGAKPLSPAIAGDAIWAHDMNGDGLPDLVSRFATGIAIWYGKGGLEVDSQGVLPPFRLANGAAFASFAGRTLSFVDANQDGASDVVVTLANSALLFVNHGHELRQVPMPLLPAGAQYPLALDLSGSGEHELAIVAGTNVTALRLTRPASGLMSRADDGRGTVAEFTYQRAEPARGLRARPIVLALHVIRTAGIAPVTRSYRFTEPTVHSRGGFLVGFDRIERTSPETIDTTEHHNDDDISGLPVVHTSVDRADLIEHVTRTTYAEVAFHGLRLLRPTLRDRGITGGPVTRLAYLTYARGACATLTRETSPRGTLERATSHASIAAIPDELHCSVTSERFTGRHTDARHDFVQAVEVARNAIGQVVEVAAIAPAGRTVLQAITYDAFARAITVNRPGHGSTQIAYDPVTGLVAQVTAPDGTTSAAIERAPATDAILVEQATLGGGLVHATSFRYDALDRLAKEWTSLAGTSSDPRVAYTYGYADASGVLASVKTRARITAAAVREEIALATGGGDTLALLRRLPGGWSVNELTSHDPTSRDVRRFVRAAISTADTPLTLAMLVGGAVERARVHAIDGGGHHASTTMSAGVVHENHTTRAAVAAGIVTTHRDGPAAAPRIRTETHDDEGRPIRRVDETGATTTLAYDTLGRLVRIALPDGAVQERAFDSFGRTARIDRSGIGARVWTYDAFGRAERIETRDRDGALVRTTMIARDAIGRPRSEAHLLAPTGEPRIFEYTYDGLVPGVPAIPGQLGKLTRTRGDRYEERNMYRVDGRLASTTLHIDGWRSVTREYDYHDDGAVASETWIVRDASGVELRRMRRDDRYDAFGRLEAVHVDGAELARMSYDANGELAFARLANGERITFRYDATTRGLAGLAHTGNGRDDATSWAWNGYGQIEQETLVVGGEQRDRTYVYDERGHLAAAYDAFETAAYTYDPSGLPESADDLAGTRTFTRIGDTLDAGGRIYQLDKLGRVTRADGVELQYGPHGALTSVRRGGVTHTFISDPQGRRIVKRLGESPIEAYVGGATVTATSLQVPYRVGGKLVGVLDNGVLRAVAADARGTRLADDAGGLDVPTPFGLRGAHATLANVVDFADQGYDDDLAAVRMGVRDYDPYLGRFLTPDPLMLDSMDACADSSVDCNLYTYAKNDPLRFVDSSGMSPEAEDLGTLQSVAPAVMSQCLPEPLMSPASVPASDEPTNEMLEVDGFQGNPFETLNKIDIDIFVFGGVGIDPVGPAPVKPEGEVLGIAGVSSQSGGYVGAIGAYGVKAGTEVNYVAAMRGAEITTVGNGEIVMLEAGVGAEVPYIAGAGVFAGQYYTHEDKGHYVGVQGGLLGAHGFAGIGGSITYDGKSIGAFFDYKPEK